MNTSVIPKYIFDIVHFEERFPLEDHRRYRNYVCVWKTEDLGAVYRDTKREKIPQTLLESRKF